MPGATTAAAKADNPYAGASNPPKPDAESQSLSKGTRKEKAGPGAGRSPARQGEVGHGSSKAVDLRSAPQEGIAHGLHLDSRPRHHGYRNLLRVEGAP